MLTPMLYGLTSICKVSASPLSAYLEAEYAEYPYNAIYMCMQNKEGELVLGEDKKEVANAT